MSNERFTRLARKAYALGQAFSRKGNGLFKDGRYNIPQIQRSIARFISAQAYVAGHEGDLYDAWMDGFADHVDAYRTTRTQATCGLYE